MTHQSRRGGPSNTGRTPRAMNLRATLTLTACRVATFAFNRLDTTNSADSGPSLTTALGVALHLAVRYA